MDTLRLSQFHPYSYGIVAANKPLNSWKVEVTPVEDLPMMDGQITDNMTQFSASGEDASGSAYQSQTNQSNTVTAVWLPICNPNRLTAPDVRRGEQVMLYRFGDDTSKYYWVTMRNDLTVRKLETVIFGVSGTAKEGDPANDDTTYIFGISAHQKKVWIHTPQANGEPFGYDITLDTDAGTFTFTDTINNKIFVSSNDHQIRFENADGSFLDITGKALTSYAADSMDFKTNAYSIECQTYKNSASSSITEDTATATLTATGGNQINANTMLAGDLTTEPGSGSTGNVKSSGNFSTSGTLEADAGISTLGTVKGQTADFQSYNNLPG
jgi:hypothetical protein